MKKIQILIILIPLLLAGTAQATIYTNCFVVANGRSSSLSHTEGIIPWNPPISRHVGFFSDIDFGRCENMKVIVIEKGTPHSLSNVSSIHLRQTVGSFMWRVFPDFQFGLPAKTRICAFALFAEV
jgi:hypothetical protein